MSDTNLLMQDLIRATEGLAKEIKKVPANEIQKLEHESCIEHYKHRISYLKRDLNKREGR